MILTCAEVQRGELKYVKTNILISCKVISLKLMENSSFCVVINTLILDFGLFNLSCMYLYMARCPVGLAHVAVIIGCDNGLVTDL